MHQFQLLLCSLFLGLVCYYSIIRIDIELRKTYVVLLTYRFLFFSIQSAFFYFVYKNQVDPHYYFEALSELKNDFYYYPEDIYRFFSGDYSQMHVGAKLHFYLDTEERLTFFVKVLTPFFIFSANNYYLLGAWLTLFGSLCFMPFLGLLKIDKARSLWLLVLLIPSFTFWTVGVLKEAFVIPSLFLLFYYFKKNIEFKQSSLISILLAVVLFILVWNVKYYLGALFLMVCVAYYVVTYLILSKPVVLFSMVLFVALLLGLGLLHPALQWDVFPEVIYISNYLTCTKFVDAYACIPFELDKSWYSVLVNLPKAIVHAFFSPFPWQIHNVTSLLAAIENYAFMILLGFLIYRRVTKKIFFSNAELLGLFIILFLGGLLIMASPNIGSFSRYRIFYLPVYTYIILKHSGVIYIPVFLRFKNWIEK